MQLSNKKYLISPTFEIGRYWANQMNLKEKEYIIVLNEDSLRGVRTLQENIIFIEGDDFDYPELSVNNPEKFNDLINIARYEYLPRMISKRKTFSLEYYISVLWSKIQPVFSMLGYK